MLGQKSGFCHGQAPASVTDSRASLRPMLPMRSMNWPNAIHTGTDTGIAIELTPKAINAEKWLHNKKAKCENHLYCVFGVVIIKVQARLTTRRAQTRVPTRLHWHGRLRGAGVEQHHPRPRG